MRSACGTRPRYFFNDGRRIILEMSPRLVDDLNWKEKEFRLVRSWPFPRDTRPSPEFVQRFFFFYLKMLLLRILSR